MSERELYFILNKDLSRGKWVEEFDPMDTESEQIIAVGKGRQSDKGLPREILVQGVLTSESDSETIFSTLQVLVFILKALRISSDVVIPSDNIKHIEGLLNVEGASITLIQNLDTLIEKAMEANLVSGMEYTHQVKLMDFKEKKSKKE